MDRPRHLSADEYLARLRVERERLRHLGEADLSTQVVPCPEWTISDLLVHLGRVHRWARRAFDLGQDESWPGFGEPPQPGSDLVAWVDEGLGDLIGDLEGRDPESPCWTFSDDKRLLFWFRRQTLETTLHRWDAQVSLGDAEPLDPDLAAVGIDEWCELEQHRWYSPSSGAAGTVHLHGTDADGEWLIEADGETFTWSRGHAKGDVAMRGALCDLYLVLWNRRPLTAIELFGDVELAQRFLDRAEVG